MSRLRHPWLWILGANAVIWGLPAGLDLLQKLSVPLSASLGQWQRDALPSASTGFQRLMEDHGQLLPAAHQTELEPAAIQPVVIEIDPALQAEGLKLVPDTVVGAPPPERERPSRAHGHGSRSDVVGEVVQPTLIDQLAGADGLGGPITLSSLEEPPMPVAARAERLAQQRLSDPLAALPLHWRQVIRDQLPSGTKVSAVATVRLPAPGLDQSQEVPVLVDASGNGDALVAPRNAVVKRTIDQWAARQQPSRPGTVQVYLVAAEPVVSP